MLSDVALEAEQPQQPSFVIRRKFSTKDCEECAICSSQVFEASTFCQVII